MEMEMEARDTGTGFSFETWVHGIIADPEGDHLSPAEAVAAAQDAAGELPTRVFQRSQGFGLFK
jgi:hypothetical protein